MSRLLDLRLIPLFNFYLAVFFVIGTVLRLRQYKTFLVLIRTMPGRWPRLFELVKQHKYIFVTWGTVLPLALMLSLFLINWLASSLVWPYAHLTIRDLLGVWPALPVVALSGAGMVAFDVYGAMRVGNVDRAQLEKYFDQAEYWLKTWVAPVVRLFTLGYINPRKMVAVEVQAALISASKLLNSTVWWVITQTGLRITYGLSLWLTWALEPWLQRLLHG
jgi:hypothetical protein